MVKYYSIVMTYSLSICDIERWETCESENLDRISSLQALINIIILLKALEATVFKSGNVICDQVTWMSEKIQTFIFRATWDNTAHFQWIKFLPKGPHLIHWTSVVFFPYCTEIITVCIPDVVMLKQLQVSEEFYLVDGSRRVDPLKWTLLEINPSKIIHEQMCKHFRGCTCSLQGNRYAVLLANRQIWGVLLRKKLYWCY